MSDSFSIDKIDQLNTNPKEANYEKKIDKSINFIEIKDEIKKSNKVLAWVAGLASGIISGVISGIIIYIITK